MNHEKYADPTADTAVNKTTKESRYKADKISMVIHIFRCVATLAGLRIVNRITLEDRKTGEMYD